MHCGSLAENIYLLTLPFHKTCLKEREKFQVIYYLILVENKSEFLFVLYPKFDMNA